MIVDNNKMDASAGSHTVSNRYCTYDRSIACDILKQKAYYKVRLMQSADFINYAWGTVSKFNRKLWFAFCNGMSCMLIVYTLYATSRGELKVSAWFVNGIENKAPK